MEALSLQGKVAIVTGSNSGIGAATAKLMARRGAQVTLHGRDQAKLDAVKEDFETAGIKSDDILCVCGDVTDASVREKLVAETVTRFGRIDILVNNAGGGEHNNYLSGVTPEEMHKTMDLLLYAPIFLSQLCVPHLTKTKGNIINISSILSAAVIPGAFPYSSAKAALDQFTKYAATEFGKSGIRVNSIRPGAVLTPIYSRGKVPKEVADEFLVASAQSSLLGFNANPEDISEIISFYASDAARFITGDTNTCDAGLTVPVVFKGL